MSTHPHFKYSRHHKTLMLFLAHLRKLIRYKRHSEGHFLQYIWSCSKGPHNQGRIRMNLFSFRHHILLVASLQNFRKYHTLKGHLEENYNDHLVLSHINQNTHHLWLCYCHHKLQLGQVFHPRIKYRQKKYLCSSSTHTLKHRLSYIRLLRPYWGHHKSQPHRGFRCHTQWYIKCC